MIFYVVPYDKLVAPVCPEAKLRKLVKNMIYVGVVAKLLDIDLVEVEKAIRKQFAKKVKAANLNLAAVKAGFDYAAANLVKRDPYFIKRMDKTAGKIIIDGNSAAALGCMFAGVPFANPSSVKIANVASSPNVITSWKIPLGLMPR